MKCGSYLSEKTFCFVSTHFTTWTAIITYSFVFKMKEQRLKSTRLCEWSPRSPTWHFLLSGLCTGASRHTPEAHWWTMGAACGLSRVVRMWTRWAGWSAMGLRIFVLGEGADWSCWARLERSGARDWLRKCVSGNLWKGKRTLWMKKQRKVPFFQSGLSEEGNYQEQRRWSISSIFSLPHSCCPLQRRAVACWPPGLRSRCSALLLESPGSHAQPPWEQHCPASRRCGSLGPGVWLGFSGAGSTTAFVLFGGFCCHYLPQS